jgi:hypothetical protein
MANNPAAVNVVCQQCGATPAKKVVFQSIAGMVIMHQIRTVKGNFCRDCGLRIKDEMNAYTLKRGWFSIGGIIGIPMFLGINAIRAGRLNKLPAPVRAQPQGWQGQPQGWQGQPQGQAQAWPGQPQPWQGQAQPQPQAWQGQPQGQPHAWPGQPQPWQGQPQGQPQPWQGQPQGQPQPWQGQRQP